MAQVTCTNRHAKFLTNWFKIICLILLTGQCVRLAIEYFNYSVYSKVAVYTPMELAVPKLSLCVPVHVLLDKRHDKEFFTHNEKSVAGKTIGHLFSISPPVNSTIVKCAYRDFGTDRAIRLDRDGCAKFFKIRIYRLFGYICYRFTPTEHKYTLYSVVNTFSHRRILYSIVIDEPLNLGYKLLPMIHLDSYPTIDRLWDQELLPSDSMLEAYTLSQNIYEIHRLPPPHQTMCGRLSSRYCTIRCIQNATKYYGVSPISNAPELDNPSLFFPSNQYTYKGRSLFEIYNITEKHCEDKCEKVSQCYQRIVQTIISSPNKSIFKLIFAVETISQPVTKSKTEASFTLLDFIFACATLASIWVGFSVLGLFDLGRACLTHDAREKRLHQMLKKCEETLVIKKHIESTLGRYSLVLEKIHPDDFEDENQLRYKPGTRRLIITMSVLVKLCLFIGFLWQTISISRTFFEFGTRTQLSFDLNPMIEAPTLAICVRYDAIMGFDDSATVTQDNFNQIFNRSDSLFDVTVGEIFKNSWTNEKIVHACRIRSKKQSEAWIMQLHRREECQTFFTGTRFFFDRNICFAQKFIDTTRESQAIKKQQVSDPGIFYSLILSRSLISNSKSDKIFVMLYPNDKKLPLESKEFASAIYKTETGRLFLISLVLHQKQSLQFPYEDQCDKYLSKAACQRICFRQKTVQQLNRLPFSDIFSEDEIESDSLADKKILTYVDLNNTNAMNTWTQIEQECYSKCIYEKCNVTVFNTLVNSGFRSRHRVELAVEAHSSPDVLRQSIAQLTFFEYSYQLFAIAAFWFAFNILSINPVAALVKNDKKSDESLVKRLKKVKKTTGLLKQLIFSLNKLFRMRLMHNAMKRKKQSRWREYLHLFFKKDTSKYYYMLEFLCFIGCIIHLFTVSSDYFSYPVTMKTLSDVERLKAVLHDFTVCLNTKELLMMNHTLISPNSTGFTQREDDFPEIPIRQIFESTPDAQDLLVACGHRGLRKSPLKSLTNRVYFFNFHDPVQCNEIFASEKFLLEASTCFKYGQRRSVDMSRIESAHLINLQSYILSLIINSTYITREFMLTVSEHNKIPSHSGVWAPTVTKKAEAVWMVFSYIKILREVLDPPYGNDGFTDGSLVGCMSSCLNLLLQSYGVMVPGIIHEPPRDNFRFLTSSDLDEPVIRDYFKQSKDICKSDCFGHNRHASTKIASFVTLLNEWKHEDDPPSGNSTQLHLTRTEYPVITIKFLAKQTAPEFFIILGSILGIWFGLSAVHFDPKRYFEKYPNVSPNQLTRCEIELEMVSKIIHQLYSFFFAWKK